MIYRFTIISDEVDDFVREIQIDPEATFFDFHEAILKSVGYANDQMTSFFICDDDWEKEKEVTLEEMDDNPEIDSWVMKETPISELIEDEKQKLLYVFDYMTERCFFIELTEIITGKDMNGAKCTKKAGEAPKQTVDFEEMAAAAFADAYGVGDLIQRNRLVVVGFDVRQHLMQPLGFAAVKIKGKGIPAAEE